MCKIQIVYKSGHIQIFFCRKFSVTAKFSKIEKMEWDGLKPHALLLGIDEIESVLQLPMTFWEKIRHYDYER